MHVYYWSWLREARAEFLARMRFQNISEDFKSGVTRQFQPDYRLWIVAVAGLCLVFSALTLEIGDGYLRLREGSWLFKVSTLIVAALVLSGLTLWLSSKWQPRPTSTQQYTDGLPASLVDRLTGLPNAYLLEERMRLYIAESDRAGRRFALMLIDLDRFRKINESFGREIGDRVLQRVAERIRGPLRDVDTVARIDGDEFALLVRINTREEAQIIATKVLNRLREPCEVVGSPLPIHASIGVAFFPEHGRDPKALVQHAIAARTVALQSENRCAVYEPRDDTQTLDRLALLAGLGDGLERGDLYLVYQPKRDLVTPSELKFEALVRWQHPTHGDLAPDQFLPFLEQTGSVIELTHWVVKEVLRLLQDVNTIVGEVAVNLSVRVLDDRSFPIWVARQLSNSGVAPEALRFEVTESAIMTDSSHALVVLRELAAVGVGISLDDFGVGYSSLTYLAHLPVDELKIDKGFITRMPKSAGDRAIVRATIELGHNLGMRVVAEGVESPEQSDMLAKLGCDILQGHLIGVAVTEKLLATSQFQC